MKRTLLPVEKIKIVSLRNVEVFYGANFKYNFIEDIAVFTYSAYKLQCYFLPCIQSAGVGR